ncbi:MAG: outer membrane beta-barrel protein [Candidatus Fibromonas sp.]|nr:outer membrane beta-barrel protein [Candidatus Fibromonas sp.]
MKKLFCLLVFAVNVAFAVQTVAVLPSDGTLSGDENELLTDKMREAALKVLPVNKFTLLKQDVVIKRLGGMENYIKECNETSCIVSLGKKAQVDYVAQCRVGKLGNRLRVTVELYEVSTGGLLGMFSDIAENFDRLPSLIDENVPDVFRNITVQKQEALPAPVKPAVLPVPPAKNYTENGDWLSWGESKTSDLENAVDVELGYKEPQKKIDSQKEKISASNEDEITGKKVSFGFRTGFNFSHLEGESSSYSSSSVQGFQFGFLLDIAVSNRFHLQPGFMYIQKGVEDLTLNYIELLPLISLKLSVFRISVGPYFGICDEKPSEYTCDGVVDFGINTGLGFDIGMFYIGVFYDHGMVNITDDDFFQLYNRTFGFNFGVNM